MAINFVKNDDIKILRDIEQFYSTQASAAPAPCNADFRAHPALTPAPSPASLPMHWRWPHAQIDEMPMRLVFRGWGVTHADVLHPHACMRAARAQCCTAADAGACDYQAC